MSKVISLKLTSGEEVVAELRQTVQVLAGQGPVISYRVKRPHILQFQQMGPGQLGLAFIPWTLSNPDIDEIDIPASHVISAFEPALKVEKQYLQQTSGISLATA
jgi:hypothetical protein